MREKYLEEMFELNEWFNGYYTQHEQKYRRLNTLRLRTDDDRDPYECLLELYAQAETNRKRIQQLEDLLKSQS